MQASFTVNQRKPQERKCLGVTDINAIMKCRSFVEGFQERHQLLRESITQALLYHALHSRVLETHETQECPILLKAPMATNSDNKLLQVWEYFTGKQVSNEQVQRSFDLIVESWLNSSFYLDPRLDPTSQSYSWWRGLLCSYLWVLFSVLICFLLTSHAHDSHELLVAVIAHLLLLAGDIELNPGPIYKDNEPKLQDLLYMSYTSENGRIVELRLMDRIKPRVTELAIALCLPQHIIDDLETKRNPVYYVLREWLGGGNLELEVTWATLIVALYKAGLVKEAKLLNEKLVEPPPVVERKATATSDPISSDDQRRLQMREKKMSRPDESKCKTTQEVNHNGISRYVLFMTAAAVLVFAILAACVIIAVFSSSEPSSNTSCTCTPTPTCTPPPPSLISTLHQVASDKALRDEFPIEYIDEPLDLCACLNYVTYANCKQTAGNYRMANTKTVEILNMWYNQSPSKLTWEDVVDTLECCKLGKFASELAHKHGVNRHYKRRN